MNTNSSRVTCLALLAITLFTVPPFALAADSETWLQTIAASGRPIVLFGDSTTALRGKTKTYGELLQQTFSENNLAIEVVNAGVPSNTTANASKRFQKEVMSRNPALVVIQFGINDSAVDVHKDPPAEGPRLQLSDYLQNIETFIDAVRSQDGEVILMTPNRLAWTKTTRELYGKPPYDVDDPEGFNVTLDGYVKGLRELAAQKKVRLVDVNAAYESNQIERGEPYSKLLADGMHPNDEGHKLVHDMLMEELSQPAPRP